MNRLETAWDGRDLITEDEFFTDVLCHPGIPSTMRTRIFAKFCQGSSKLSFQCFVIGIVLLTKADKDTRLGILSFAILQLLIANDFQFIAINSPKIFQISKYIFRSELRI